MEEPDDACDAGRTRRGITRGDAYLINVVNHLKFEERGRRRIHQTIHPSAILRQRGEGRAAEREAFARDLSALARALG